MLSLTRYPGQSILIGDDISITVLEAYHGKVKILVNAPKKTAIDRLEVADDIRLAREAAIAPLSDARAAEIRLPIALAGLAVAEYRAKRMQRMCGSTEPAGDGPTGKFQVVPGPNGLGVAV